MTKAKTQRSSSHTKNLACPNWKRALDIVVSLISLTLLAPLILLIILAIKVVSNGPILFRQKRIGLDGKAFMLLKFRSMKVDVDTTRHQDHSTQFIKSDSPMIKLDHHGDSRLIPGAKLLRASGFDELPQLLNVLIGNMSIVGPRPCIESEYAHYTEEQRERFNALPGLTGLWQVSGKNKTTFQEMIRLDLRYIEEMSLLRDIYIIAKTPFVLLSQIAEASVASSQAFPSAPRKNIIIGQ